MTNKTALLVSLNFPPSQIASVHRARHLAKHLPSWGWHPVVLAVDERFHKEPPDPNLASLVPPDVIIHRVKAVPLWMTRPFGLGDLAIRSYHHVTRKLDQLIIDTKPSIIFITGWPFYQMLSVSRIKRRFRIPVVLDFQDPWVSAHGATRKKWSKEGVTHRLAVALEPRVLRDATHITSVSDLQNAEMAARYPWLDPSSMTAIPIGGDPDDFKALGPLLRNRSHVRLDPARINLTYVGTFLPRAEPLVRQLLHSLAALRQTEPNLAAQVRLNFVGTSNQPDGRNLLSIAPLAAQEGVGDLVIETPQRVPFLDALALLVNSHGLLLIGSDEPHYTASKIYPALISGRPYLSLFHKASSAHSTLSSAGGGLALSFSTTEELIVLQSALTNGLRALAFEPEQFGRADPSVCELYSANAMAGRFATLFEALCRSDTKERKANLRKIPHAN